MSELISGTVENGAIVAADFPVYRGPMAIEEVNGEFRGGYPSNEIRLKRVPIDGTIDGRPARITFGQRSKEVRTVMIVTLAFLD